MTEPLTDGEFEALGGWVRKVSESDFNKNVYPFVTTGEKIDRFIATIELQKSDINLGRELVYKIQELKKERNILSRKLNQHKSRREFLLEQVNAKLREELKNHRQNEFNTGGAGP